MGYIRLLKAKEENLIKIGSPEHKDIRNSYKSALTGSVPVFESEVRVNNALNKIDNMLRRDGVESTKRWLQGIVYDIVGIKYRNDADYVYQQLSDYIEELEEEFIKQK